MTMKSSTLQIPFKSKLLSSFSGVPFGGEGGCVYPTPDWSTWDGTNDGALVQDYLDGGYWNTGGYCNLSETTALHVYVTSDDAGITYELQSAIITIDPCAKTLALGTPTVIDTSTGNFGLPDVVKMSETRFLVHYTENGVPSSTFYLLDETGTVIDTATFTSGVIDNASSALTSHSATVAVLSFDHRSNHDGYLLAIDTTSDNITFGTETEFLDAATVGFTGIVALSATRGMVVTDTYGWRYTLSGTTITPGADLQIVPTNFTLKSEGKITGAIEIDTDTILVYAKDKDGSNSMYAAVVTDDGTTQTRVDTVTVETGVTAEWKSENLTQVQQYESGVQDGYYLAASQQPLNGPAKVYMLKWDGTNITLEATVDATTPALPDADHPGVHAFNNGAAMLHYQDSVLWDWKVLTP